MSDYTKTYLFTKQDNIDVVEAADFDSIETEFGLIETAVNSKADNTGDTVSIAVLTVTTSATFAGATIADLGTVTTAILNGGTIAGSLTWSAAQDLNSQVLTNVNFDSGDISSATISGSLTWSSAQDLNNQILTNVNIDSGDISAATISGALTWSATQDSVTLTNVDINSGAIDGTAIGAASASTGDFTTLDYLRATWTQIDHTDSPVTAVVGAKYMCACTGAIVINLPAGPTDGDTIVVRTDENCTSTNKVTLTPSAGLSVGDQTADDTVSIDLPFTTRVLIADTAATPDNWDM